MAVRSLWPRLVFRNVWFLLVREISAYEVVRSGCRIRYQVGRNLILFVNKKVIFYANASIKLYLFSGLFLYCYFTWKVYLTPLYALNSKEGPHLKQRPLFSG